MNNLIKYYFLIIFIAIVSSVWSQDSLDVVKVYKMNIKEEIAPPVWHHTKKAFAEARAHGADLIIIEMNTYGGMLEMKA